MTTMGLPKTAIIILLLLLPAVCPAQTSPVVPLIKITGHPATDIEPVISPDGSTMAFVTDRDGDFNIYVKPVSRGIPHRITKHTSADFNPCFARNGEEIFFVSRRDDALGDIYRLKIESGIIKRITRRIGYDIEPSVSPDGKLLTFCSDRETGQPEVFIAGTDGKIIRRITSRGGINPCWAPDGRSIAFIALDTTGFGADNHLAVSDLQGNIRYIDTGPGPAMNPYFTPDGRIVLFTKYGVDTNRDGVLSIEDKPSVSGYYIESGRAVKFLFGTEGVSNPRIDNSGDWLYCVLEEKNDKNLARIDLSRLMDIYADPDSLYDYGIELSTSASLDHRLVSIQYLETCGILYPEYEFSADALFRCGLLYKREGFLREAESAWNRIAAGDPVNPAGRLAALQIIELEAERRWALDRRSALRRALGKIDELRVETAGNSGVSAEGSYLRGTLLRRYDNYSEALASFETVIDSFPRQANTVCRSILRIADIYRTLNPDDRISNAVNYFRVMEICPDEVEYADSAIMYVLGQYNHLPFNEQIEGVRELLRSFPMIKKLQAAGEFRIAEVFEENSNLPMALDRYISVYISYPDQQPIASLARYKSGELYIRMGAGTDGRAQLDSLLYHIESPDFVDSLAANTLYDYFIVWGDSLYKAKDFINARQVFKFAISNFPEKGDAHWCFVKCCSAMDDLRHVQTFYDDLRDSIPDNRGIRYGEALLDAEYFNKYGRKGNLRNARLALEDLTETCFDWEYPYVSLGDVYLKTEMARMDLDEGGFAERAIDLSLIGISNLEPDSPENLRFHLYLNTASGYYDIGQFQQSYSYYIKCYDFIADNPDEQLRLNYLWNLGDAALQIDSLETAVNCFEQILAAAEKRSDSELRLRLLLKLGFVYIIAEDFDRARRYLNSALEIEEARSDAGSKAETLKAQAVLNFFDREYSACVDYAKRADSIYGTLSPSDDIKTVGLLLGRLPLLPVDFQLAALEEIKIGGSFYPRGFPYKLDRRLLKDIASEGYLGLGDIHDSADRLKSKLNLELKSNDDYAAGITANDIGHLYLHAGNPDSAAIYYHKAMSLSEKADLYTGTAVSGVNLCNLMLSYPALFSTLDRDIIRKTRESLHNYLNEFSEEISSLKMYINCALGAWAYYEYQIENGTPGDQQSQGIGLENRVTSLIQERDSYGEKLIDAYDYFKAAKEMALKLRDNHARAVIDYNLALIYMECGKFDSADRFLSEAEGIANENGFGDILWQIKLGKGVIDPASYVGNRDLMQSVDILQTLRGKGNPFLYREVMPRLSGSYDVIVKQLIAEGHPDDAFQAVELFRSMSLAGEFSRYPIRNFRSELHKVYWQNIRYLEEMVDSLSSMIRALKTRDDPEAYIAIDSLDTELDEIESELSSSLDKIESEFPALAPLVSPKPFADSLLYNLLGENGVLLDYRVFDNGIGIWFVSERRREFVFKPVEIDVLHETIDKFLSQDAYAKNVGAPDSNNESATLFSLLFDDFYSEIENSGQVVIIPDGELLRIPFSMLARKGTALSDICDYTISTSVISAINGYHNRRIPASGYLKITRDKLRSDTLINLSPEKPDDEVAGVMSDYGILVFEDGIIPQDGYPIGSRLLMPGLTSLDLSRLLTLRLNCRVAVIRNPGIDELEDLLPALQACFNYAGAPSIIISRWPVPDSIWNEFMDSFIGALDENDPVQTGLGSARTSLRGKYPDPVNWAFAELVGYRGMDNREEYQFALQNFRHTMQKGNLAAGEGNWKDALDYYQETLKISSKLSLDSGKTMIILRRIVLSAVNAGEFETADRTQKRIIEYDYHLGETEQIADDFLELVSIARRAEQYSRAAVYFRQYMQVAGIGADSIAAATGFANMASDYDMAGDYSSAMIYADSAIAYLSSYTGSAEYAQVLLIKGRIATNLGQNATAMAILENVTATFALLGLSEEKAAAQQLLGWAQFRQNLYFEAEANLNDALAYALTDGDSSKTAYYALLLSSAKWAVGDFDSSLILADFASDYYRNAGDDRNFLNARLRGALSYIYSDREDEGEKILISGLNLADSVNSRLHQAAFAENLGRFYLRRDDYKKAVDFFKLALSYTGLKTAAGDELIELHYDLALSVGLHQGTAAADKYFRAADSLLEAHSLKDYYRLKYHLIYAAVMEGNGESGKAADYLREQLKNQAFNYYPHLKWRTYYLAGRAEFNDGDIKEALSFLTNAAAVIESMPVIPEGELLRSRLPYYPWDVYSLLAQCRFRRDDPTGALLSFQKASHYKMASIVSKHHLNIDDPVLNSTLSKTIRRMFAYHTSLRTLQRSTLESPESIYRQLNGIKNRYLSSIAELRERHPPLSLLFSVPALKLEDIQSGGDNGPIMVYQNIGEKLYIFTIDNDYFDAVELDMETDFKELNKQILTTITSISQTDRIDSLIAPMVPGEIAGRLIGGGRITVIPLGQTAGLPFNYIISAALPETAGAVTVNYLPSLYDLVYHNKLNTMDTIDVRFVSATEKRSSSIVNFFSKAMTLQRARRTYDIRPGNLAELGKGDVDRGMVISDAGIRDNDGGALYYRIGGSAESPSNEGLRLIDMLDSPVRSGFLFETTNLASRFIDIDPEDIALMRRLLISCGFNGLILPQWNYTDLEKGLYLKDFTRSLEKYSPAEAVSRVQKRIIGSGKRHPYYWAGYYYVGLD